MTENDEELAVFKKALQEHERLIVYCDYDEFPNSMFMTNLSIIKECEQLLGDAYKVFYILGDMPHYSRMCYLIYGHSVTVNMNPYIALYKNGIEVAQSDRTHFSNNPVDWIKEKPSNRLTNWIKKQLK